MSLDLTLPQFQDYLKSNQWQSDPESFIEIVKAFRSKRNTYTSPFFKRKANVALKEAGEYINALRNAGFNLNNSKNSSISSNSSNSSNSNTNSGSNSNVSPETLAKIAALSPTKANSGLDIFREGAIVTLTGGRKMMVHKRGVNKQPLGIWLINEDGSLPTLNNGSKGPDLYGLNTITAVNGVLFNASAYPESAELSITPEMCGTLSNEWIEEWVADHFSGLATGYSYGTRSEDIHPTFNKRFEIKGTMGDGTCLLHAFLTDVSPTYRSLNRAGKGVVGQAFRRDIYQYLFPSKKEVIVDPRDLPFTKGIAVRKGKDAKGNPRIYTLARDYIGKTDGYLYSEDMKMLAKCFNIRIIALNPDEIESQRIQLIGEVNPKELKAEYDAEVAAGSPLTRYIFIYAYPGHYESGKLKGAEQYIFTYPELRDVINAAAGETVSLNNQIKALFKEGTKVILKDGRKMTVAEDEIRWESRDISPTESVLDPVGIWLKTKITGPKGELFMLDEIAEVKGAPFNSSKFKPPKPSRSAYTRKVSVSSSSNNNVSPATLKRRIQTLKVKLHKLKRSISNSTSSNTIKKSKKNNKSKKPSMTVRRQQSTSSSSN